MSKLKFTPRGSSLRPGIVDGYYPERPQLTASWLQETIHSFAGLSKNGDVSRNTFQKTLKSIHHHGQFFEKLNDAELTDQKRNLREQLYRQGLTKDLTRQAFALVRETAWRTVHMRHFDCQLIGGWIMVHGGLAEMETGEGKTLTATLAASTAALAGIPVHIVTVNDYLVTRDARQMGPIYHALGLRVGTVTAGMDSQARRNGYSCDITYCTNKQLAFDYLRDRILLGNDQGRLRLQLERLHNDNARTERLFLRGLCFAIIDEADSVLIDEARTPLVISRQIDGSKEEQTYLQAVELAEKIERDTDFTVDQIERRIQLNDQGNAKLADAAKKIGGIWNSPRYMEELVCQALSARYLYQLDRHYLVQDGKVMIIDENTGRVMADRSWERGLHQMIEIKEHCEVTGQREHIARLTYQRFFRRYLRLSGMTGTAKEVRRELWSVYHLPVVKVPTNKPGRRIDHGHRIYADKKEKWAAVVRHIREVHQRGRPVLIGTRSVEDSEHLSLLLHKEGIAHQILNARQDAWEAEIVAKAGEKGCITVATNMAGRGTDIPLGATVAENGGLHVISTECNEARRIDRQLYGRSGRQGDPGSYESILSLDDELLSHHLGDTLRSFLFRFSRKDKTIPKTVGLLAMRLAQSARERRYHRMRRDMLQMDENLGKLLAFSGQME